MPQKKFWEFIVDKLGAARRKHNGFSKFTALL
jgi:hypothetical protein